MKVEDIVHVKFPLLSISVSLLLCCGHFAVLLQGNFCHKFRHFQCPNGKLNKYVNYNKTKFCNKIAFVLPCRSPYL